MTSTPTPKVFRLRKKHDPRLPERPTAAEGERLVRGQSVWHGLLAGLIAVVLFAVAWSMTTRLLDQFFPWLSLLLGGLVGLAVRRGGQGFDWRFPAIAAVLAFAGAFLGIIVISAGTTAAEFDTNTFVILRNVTTMTWPVFFDEVLTAADGVYAGFAALIAGALSLRRLDRREFQAVRLWEESRRGD